VPKGGLVSASVLIASLLEHASRPLHVWLLGRADDVEQRLAGRFPQLSLTWVPTRGLARGLGTPTGERPDPASVVRLLLPDLLPGAARVVVLPTPSVATGDVAELADLDLGGHALAAPLRPGTSDASGFGVIHAAAMRLEDRSQAASALRRTAHARHAFDFDAFTADVLVLDLERLRRERFTAQALPLVAEFGLDDVEVLHYLFGPRHAIVPDRWALVPTRAPRRGPGLIHWADAIKPWQQQLTPDRDEWRRHASAFAQA
jgi:lipopolysaccharide biosynthesis glycosyltransferase